MKLSTFLLCFLIGIEKDVPNVVRQKQSSRLFLGRGLPIPVRGTKCATLTGRI